MVEVRVAGVALDASGQHVILLKPADEAPGEGRILPIWIGAQEATSILVAVEGADTPRPLAHDLMRTMLETLGAAVETVEVTRIDGGTFFAEITLGTTAGTTRIDARPSDAVALACRVGATIHVADAVLDEAGIPDTVTGDESDAEETVEDEADQEERVDEFKRFLDDVDPEDFRDA
ncbi:bifunctional nuclease family protein [Microbacterium sp. CJ88]|uniref:bifunctional nuclease family protein n=1 Tax=Microbacterium sp. CJ88 TaxID=3445672 RepID=UPI003F660A6C